MSSNALLARWEQWSARFAAISRRERIMVSAAVVVGVVMLGSSLVLEPSFNRVKIAQKNLLQQTGDLVKIRLQVAEIQAQSAVDPNAAQKEELARLEERLKAFGQTMAETSSALVPPEKMNALLERMLARQPGLRLLSLRSLPPTSVLAAGGEAKKEVGASAAPAAEPGAKTYALYRHGVEIRVAGTYQELYQYLTLLESDRQKLIWGEMRLSVAEHPTAVLTLVVYTLSPEQAWLSI